MKKDVMNIMVLVRMGELNAIQGTNKILSLMGENETGVSDSQATHGALPLVRTMECEAKSTTESNSEAAHGTLENRIDSENEGYHECPHCGHKSYLINDHYRHIDLFHHYQS